MLNARETLDHVVFRAATVEDVASLADLYGEFFTFSDMPALDLAFAPDLAAEAIRQGIETGRRPHIVATDRANLTVVGAICYVLDHTSTRRPFAALVNFYVRPDWRLSAIGRVLLSLAMQDAAADGAVAFRAGLAAGVPYTKNLFARLGFHETPDSVLMSRRL